MTTPIDTIREALEKALRRNNYNNAGIKEDVRKALEALTQLEQQHREESVSLIRNMRERCQKGQCDAGLANPQPDTIRKQPTDWKSEIRYPNSDTSTLYAETQEGIEQRVKEVVGHMECTVTFRPLYAAPQQVDTAKLVEAGDEMTKAIGSLTNFILKLRPDERYGHFTPQQLEAISKRWQAAKSAAPASSKPLTMQDVLLHCGELNKRERVAVQWVLDRQQQGTPQRLSVERVMQEVGLVPHFKCPYPAGTMGETKYLLEVSEFRDRITKALNDQ